MKTTRKEYQEKYQLRSEYNRAKAQADQDNDMPTYFEAKSLIEELDNEYFNKLTKVNVSYSIGSRGYAREVVKIGKSYFQHGESMTAGRGYWGLLEIEAITDEMKQDMLADSYYY